MAEAAVSFAVEKLGNLLIHKIDFLLGVEDKITTLKHDLQWMRSFLKDASEKQAKDEMIRIWISDIRDLAHDAEDVIDSFALTVDTPRESRGMLGRCVCFPQQVYHLDKLGQDIESIRRRLEAIGSRRETYRIKSLDDDMAGSSAPARRIDDVERRRRVFPWKPDKHLVGLEKHAETLLRKSVLVEKKGLCIASIVGMGGVGKSTLAKHVYNHAEVKRKFERRAWVTVSRDFSSKELLKAMVKMVLEPSEDKEKVVNIMKEASEEELMQMVHKRLEGKQYMVVVDDVWRQQDWEYLAQAFPDDQAKASRVLITSRTQNISRDAQFVHKLDGLDSENSWELFLQVALNENSEGKCPPELEGVGKEIMEKCKGLPLAIVVIGGLLLEQGPIVSRWEKVSRGVTSYFRGSGDSVGAILELSYHDLPPHLKACFLCLSFLREDARIWARHLVKVWIAEGFVPDNEGEMTMEEIGMSYFDELINRNMVQVDDLNCVGEVDSYRMHDLLRDLSIIKAKEEIKFDIVREENALEAMDKARHIAIYSENEMVTLFRSPRSHVRSLFFHKSAHSGDGGSYRDDFWRNFDGIRVLSLDKMGLTVIPKMIGRLIGLRFLSLFDNKIHQLPKSIGRLKNLQTLYIKGIEKMKVPNVLWKLDSLRHLYMGLDIICEVPLKLDTLKNLQTIYCISINSIVVEHFKELIDLRELDVELVLDADTRGFFNSLSMLRILSLFLRCRECISLDGIQNLKHITELYIDGPLEKLPNELPPSISVLKLSSTRLREDPMLVLERLPKLSHLEILFSNAYEELVIRENGFPCLRVLGFDSMEELRKLYIQSGALSKLEQLSLGDCPKLEMVPKQEELRIMRNLQKLVILNPSKEISDKLKSVNYSDALSNIPSVQISDDPWGGDPSDE